MESLKADGILKSVDIQTCSGDNSDECGPEGTAIRVDVVVVPPADVGSFSEEDRSRQVSTLHERPALALKKSRSIDMLVVFPPQDTHIFPTHSNYHASPSPTLPAALTIFSGPIAD